MLYCFDIGGSKTVLAQVNDNFVVKEMDRVETPTSNYQVFCNQIRDMVPNDDIPIGISIAGVIHPNTGVLTSSNIPSVNNRPLAQDLTNLLNRNVFVVNDADAFGLSEAVLGCGIGHSMVFAVILGTGVGGAIILNQSVISGANGSAGEWGHGSAVAMRTGAKLPVVDCGCGQVGCLDTIGGARGLERLHFHFHGTKITSFEILQNWHNKEPNACHTVDVYLDVIGGALANTVNIIGPSVVPIGGGLANNLLLIQALDEEVRGRTLVNLNTSLLKPAIEGPERGLSGAAIYALEQLKLS